MLNLILDLKKISHVIISHCVIGISIVLLHMIFPSYLYLNPITLTIFTTLCLSEIYLDSSVPYDDPRLNLLGYKLGRADNLSNNIRSGVGVYFKETLAIRPVPTNSLKRVSLTRE